MGDFDNVTEVFGDEAEYQFYLQTMGAELAPVEDEPCPHRIVVDRGDFQVCADCGDTKEILSYDAEWRFYGANDNKSSKDPSRCHYVSNTASRNIKKMLEIRKIPEAIIAITIQKYETVVGPKTMRGEKRNGIIAICLWRALLEGGDFRTVTEVGALFKLDRKNLYKGLQSYSVAFPEDRTLTITPSHLLQRTMQLADIRQEHHHEISELCSCLQNKSKMLTRSNPQSVSASVVWVWLCLNPTLKLRYAITKSVYAARVSLSEITISKLAKEAFKFLPKPVPLDVKL